MAKALSRTVSIYIDGKQVDSTLKALSAKLQELKNRQRTLTLGSEEYIQTSLKIQEINNVLREHNRALQRTETTLEGSLNKLSNIGNMITGLQSVFAMGDAAVGSLKDLVQAATELDDIFADVMKTTGLTHDQVVALNEEFKKMDTRTSIEQLNQLAYEAGKLGISAKEDVLQFVNAADKINIALGDVLGEGAMVTIGKLTEVYSRATDMIAGKDLEGKMLAIGSAINSLGQASTANEAYLVDFMSRLGGIADQAGMSADQILGYASAFDQANLAVEMSATAFQKLIQQMISKPEEFIAAARMPMEEFKNLIETDMNAAIQRVLQGMDEMGGFQQLLPVFKDMGLDGARAASAISSLAGSLTQVSEAQAIANEQLRTGNSIESEFATKNSSLQAEADKAKKSFEAMRFELGEKLYPVVIHLTKASTATLKGLSGYLTLWKENRVAAAALTAGLITLVGWYTREYATKLKVRALDLIRSAQQKAQIMQTNLQTAAEARHTVAIEKSRLAYLKQQMAIQQKILADRAEYEAMGAHAVVMAAERNSRALASQITKQQTAVTTAHTAAVNANKAALASTPWGAVIAAVTALAVGMAKLVKHQGRFRAETKELNKQIGNETAQATYLFDRLKKADEKTEEYRSTMSKLNELYPDIIKHYTDEEGHLTNIAAARQEVINKIREQITEQRRLDKYGQIQGTFEADKDDALARLRNRLVRSNGKKGEQQFQAFVNSLPADYSQSVTKSDFFAKYKSATGINLESTLHPLMEKAVSDLWSAFNTAFKESTKWDAVYGAQTKTNGNATATPQPEPSNTNTTPTIPEPVIDKAADKAAEKAAKELQAKGEKNAEAAAKLLNDLAAKYTVPTVQSQLADLDKQIATITQGLEDAFATKDKEGGLHWTNEEMRKLHDNLQANQEELQKGVINDWVQKLGDDTNDLQQRLNDLEMVDLAKVAEIDPEAAQDLQDLIEFFRLLKEAADNASNAMEGANDKINDKEWQDNLKSIAENIDKFSSSALKMWDSINTIISNTETRTLNSLKQTNDEQMKELDDSFNRGLISQENYEKRRTALQEEYEAKQKEAEKKSFARNKAYSIAEATIAAALAVMRVLADKTLEGPLRWVQLAAVSAESALQIAAIASEPAPYALGGYTKQPTVLVGERGQEWVASNRLLRDPNTAPLISALEDYQRGRISMASVNMQGVGTVADNRAEETQQLKMLNAQMAQLAKYLSDPHNRQAYITRQSQELFDKQENFLRSVARR